MKLLISHDKKVPHMKKTLENIGKKQHESEVINLVRKVLTMSKRPTEITSFSLKHVSIYCEISSIRARQGQNVQLKNMKSIGCYPPLLK